MKDLGFKETAAFLKMMPEGLQRKAASGEISGARAEKYWCFREGDFAEYLVA